MACATCPYLANYELLWQVDGSPPRTCVMLWCCAGPELQIRDGDAVVLDEYYEDPEDLYARAEALRPESARTSAPDSPAAVHLDSLPD